MHFTLRETQHTCKNLKGTTTETYRENDLSQKENDALKSKSQQGQKTFESCSTEALFQKNLTAKILIYKPNSSILGIANFELLLQIAILMPCEIFNFNFLSIVN